MYISTSAILTSLLATVPLVNAIPQQKIRAVSTSTTSSSSSSSSTSSSTKSALPGFPASTTSATTNTTKVTTLSKPTSTSTSTSASASSSSTKISTTTSISSSTSIKTTTSTTTSKITTSTTTTSTTTKTTSTTTTTSSNAVCTHAGKRGLGYNDPVLTEQFALCNATGSKVSWAYDWASDPYYPNAPNSSTTYNMALRFVPMLWSAASGLTAVWGRNIQAARAQYGADALLAFNEPDNCDGQACMSVADAVAAYKAYLQPYAGQFLLGAPAVTNGQGSGVGLDWLAQFLNQCGSACTVDFIPLHFYGDVSKPDTLGSYISAAHQQFGKPIWVTEFGATSGSADQVRSWASSVMAWMDAQSYVVRYAYLMDAVNSDDTWLIGSNRSMNAMGMLYNS